MRVTTELSLQPFKAIVFFPFPGTIYIFQSVLLVQLYCVFLGYLPLFCAQFDFELPGPTGRAVGNGSAGKLIAAEA